MLTGNKIVDEVSQLHINSIPEAWYKTIRKNNQPYALAILVLWEIVYWYKWTEVRSEVTGCVVGYKKKFSADLLQRSYGELSKKFGISKKVATEVISFLVKLGVITREFRTIHTNNTVLNNVLFLGINPDVLKTISSEVNNISKEDSPVSDLRDTLSTKQETPSIPTSIDSLSLQGDTNTTNSTTNSTTNDSCDSDISQNTDTKKLSSQSHDYSDNFPEENQETEISHFVDLDIKNNKLDLSEHNESHLVDKENDNNEKSVISSQSHDYSEITPTTAADIPFPEDVKEKKTKKVSKKADTPSFPRQDYKDVMDLYYQTRNELSSRMNVTDAIFKPSQTNALLKDYFTKYGVEKCKLAIKNASKHSWILNKTDFSIYSVFNKSMFEKFLEDTSVVTNKKLRHQMFFNDPKHSHIDYENQDYKEGY